MTDSDGVGHRSFYATMLLCIYDNRSREIVFEGGAPLLQVALCFIITASKFLQPKSAVQDHLLFL